MKLITFTCPKCGAQMEVNPELEAIICNYILRNQSIQGFETQNGYGVDIYFIVYIIHEKMTI